MTLSALPESPARTTGRAKPKFRRRMLRPLFDAVIAGVAFTLVSSALVCAHAKAGIIPSGFPSATLSASFRPVATNAVAEPAPLPIVHIATASSAADAVYRQTSVTAAWALLGVAFSLMAALNLAMMRHLKRVYAPAARRFPPGK